MICLGAGFQYSNWEGRGGVDFLLETQARQALGDDTAYMRNVMRLEWIAFLLGEDNRTVLVDCLPCPQSPWSAMALVQRKRLVGDDPSTPGVVRSVISHNNKIQALIDRPNDREPILRQQDGMIVIPAASPSKPTRETKQIFFPKSFLGGRQLLLSTDSSVEYTLSPDMLTETPTKYHLTCRVCTVHRNEDPIVVTISPQQKSSSDDAKVAVEMPYTMGMWEETKPVTIELGGPGVTFTKLIVTRQRKQFAIAMKDIKLVPV